MVRNGNTIKGVKKLLNQNKMGETIVKSINLSAYYLVIVVLLFLVGGCSCDEQKKPFKHVSSECKKVDYLIDLCDSIHRNNIEHRLETFMLSWVGENEFIMPGFSSDSSISSIALDTTINERCFKSLFDSLWNSKLKWHINVVLYNRYSKDATSIQYQTDFESHESMKEDSMMWDKFFREDSLFIN